MDSANVLDIFTCGICLETFDESSKCPRILSCGHSFCHSCLRRVLVLNPFCPTCKAEIMFLCTESIPINFSLKSLINIRSQILVPNTSTYLEGQMSDSHTKGERRTSSRKFLSKGYCNEHENFKELRCMDCKVWICGLCSTLRHKHCRTLVVEEAYKELKKQVSQKVKEELGQRKKRTERLTESLRVMEVERKSLIEEIKRKELELKDREKQIKEVESLKAEENKFCDKLKQLQTMVKNSANDAEFSRTLMELEKCLEEGKMQIPVDLHHRHLPYTREALGMLCENGSVFVVEYCNDGIKYGEVALEDGRILITSFKPEKPENSTLFSLPELLSRFNNGSSELPKTGFLRVTPDDEYDRYRFYEDYTDCDDYSNNGAYSFEVIIETDGLTPRAKNFIFLCSALGGPSYKGIIMKTWGGSSGYVTTTAPFPVVDGIRRADPVTPRKVRNVYGMREDCSWFQLQLKSYPSYPEHEFGVILEGVQELKDLRRMDCHITECGLVI